MGKQQLPQTPRRRAGWARSAATRALLLAGGALTALALAVSRATRATQGARAGYQLREDAGGAASANGGPPAVHASSVLRLESGGVLVAFFGGEHEGAPDVAVWLAVRSSSGVWARPRRVAKVADEAHWNPVLFREPGAGPGSVTMHFKVGDDIPTWRTYVTRSANGGASWSKPVELVAGDVGGRGCVRTKPLVAADGTLLCGASTEAGRWVAFVDASTDGGRTWHRTPDFQVADGDDAGLIQPSLWLGPSPMVVHALMRSDVGAAYRASSLDGGQTWGMATRTKLPNNNSGLDVARLNGGILVAAYNPVTGNWGARYPLRLSISIDDGHSWQYSWDIETEPGEYSYPALVPWPRGRGFDLTYTHHRTKVVFASMSLSELRKRARSASRVARRVGPQDDGA